MAEGDPGTRRVTADELALRVGIPPAQVEQLADRAILERDADGRFDPGDVHRLRLLRAFADAGVPLDALVAADRAGTISLRYYDQLHPPPPRLSDRTYAEFAASLGDAGSLLPRLYSAFGLAEPVAGARLGAEDEELLGELARALHAIGQPDLTLRAIRIFGEAARRSADGALGVYAEAVSRSDESVAGLPIDEVFLRTLQPWARFARTGGAMAGWLTEQHMSRAIDSYSLTSTEEILEAGGFVPARQGPVPAVAFVDLTGFTRLTESIGDEAAAALALRLGDVAAETVQPFHGRVVKLLGDGVLLHFDDPPSAIDATLALLGRLGPPDLPTGHAGIAAGSLIVRDNDVFGRTVNLAARISDVAPDGQAYLPRGTASALQPNAGFTFEDVEAAVLQGIGHVDLSRVVRAV